MLMPSHYGEMPNPSNRPDPGGAGPFAMGGDFFGGRPMAPKSAMPWPPVSPISAPPTPSPRTDTLGAMGNMRPGMDALTAFWSMLAAMPPQPMASETSQRPWWEAVPAVANRNIPGKPGFLPETLGGMAPPWANMGM